MIVVIIGPTGVGKTKLSIEIAKKINAEIINADAMQVYKGLDIATAKIKEEEKEGIPHHLFDICEVEDNFTVYDYQKLGREKINEITKRGKNIIIVGGTGLYIKALLYNYEFVPENKIYDFSNLSDQELITKIKILNQNIDIDFNNRRRLERTLIKLLENSSFEKKGNNPIYDFTIVGLTTARENLYNKINERVFTMLDDGLLEEARKMYVKKGEKSLRTGIGYKEIFEYFDGKLSLDDAIKLIQKNSRHYAKRQYTFFKNQFKDKEICWFETNYDDFSKTVDEVYSHLLKKIS